MLPSLRLPQFMTFVLCRKLFFSSAGARDGTRTHRRKAAVLETAAKLYQFVGIHSGYFPFDFLEISHRINLLYLSSSSRDTRGGISSYVSAVQFSLHNTYSPFVDSQPRLILHPQKIRAD